MGVSFFEDDDMDRIYDDLDAIEEWFNKYELPGYYYVQNTATILGMVYDEEVEFGMGLTLDFKRIFIYEGNKAKNYYSLAVNDFDYLYSSFVFPMLVFFSDVFAQNFGNDIYIKNLRKIKYYYDKMKFFEGWFVPVPMYKTTFSVYMSIDDMDEPRAEAFIIDKWMKKGKRQDFHVVFMESKNSKPYIRVMDTENWLCGDLLLTEDIYRMLLEHHKDVINEIEFFKEDKEQ